ncbi:hypothetical protein [Streptacidiphilus monticola]|uniref:Low molecular weight antigen MTB12-like C-terminal domain-containing protein n=1 Tax=Streptacidiphilus monticola TaxID=2161674 RepID=A0ABW1FVZ4_9ACTN
MSDARSFRSRRGARAVLQALLAVAVLLIAAACSSSSSSKSAVNPTVGATGASGGAQTGASSSAAAPSSSAAAAAPCGTGAAPKVSGTGPADPAAAAQQISANWAKFFNPATPAAEKIGLLENGTAFAPVLHAFGGNSLAAHASATVTAVQFSSATAAGVTYNLCVGGQPQIPGASGHSVQHNGVWQVSDSTLCGLLKLSGSSAAAVPGCS